MAKTKITTLKIASIDGVALIDKIEIPVYFERTFFCYIPDDIAFLIKEEDKMTIFLRKAKDGHKAVAVLMADSPEKIHTKIYSYYSDLFTKTVKEEKVIAFRFKYNTSSTYFNHGLHISFADTPALSLWWNIYYKVTLPDGRVNIMSHKYDGYGTICSSKFSTPVDTYKEKWIDWTEERERFFASTTAAMEKMIENISKFFGKDAKDISLLIDSKANLLGSGN